MSFISGPECAVSSNPLSQVVKLTEGDRSLQQDRAVGPSSSRPLHHLPGTSAPGATEHDLAMARQFFEGNSTIPSAGPNLVPSANVSVPEFARLAEMNARASVDPTGSLIREQHHVQASFFDEGKEASPWAAEFGAVHPLTMAPPTQRNPSTPMESLRTGFAPLGLLPMNMRQGFPLTTQFPLAVDTDKGKGKDREIDFESAFAEVTASLESNHITAVDSEKGKEISNVDLESAFAQAAASSESTQVAASSESTQASESTTIQAETSPEDSAATSEPIDTAALWESIKSTNSAEDLAKWEAQFKELMSAEREDLEYDYGADTQQAWENETRPIDRRDDVDDAGFPILGPYVFEPNNKYMVQDNASSLNAAKELLNKGGSLSEAALMLEAAIQKGDLGEGGYEAWILLGECRSMDECEDAALRALNEGVKKAEAAGSTGSGMLSLAISYTNEQYNRASYTTLLRWVQARFPSHPVSEEVLNAISRNALWDTHARVRDVFISLARTQHQQGVVDPEVQIGLGILFYTDADFDRAKDCFETALLARPSDALLWNRLGSSLSNAGKPEEALSAYREALHLRPTYTRAIYNVGVACLNIGAHKEAAEHFLSALAMQEGGGSGSSDQIWSTFRRALGLMGHHDLVDQSYPSNHPGFEVYRSKGFDF